ncbi:MAG: pilus assembly protein PilM [Candidatus Omnitrophica bacterium]|nr:pilus assembly protein PilM [Candidatus Omnitrophota bacterium]
MSKRDDMFYYLRTEPKMLSIDIGSSSVKFLAIRKDEDRYILHYEILDENLFDLDQEGMETIMPNIREIMELLCVKRTTPTYISFSHDIQIAREENMKLIMQELKHQWLTIPFGIKNDITAPGFKNVYLMTPQLKVEEILDLFKGCNINISAYSVSPLALPRASNALFNEDDWYDTTAIVDIGANEILCCVSAGYYVLSLQKFYYGGNRLGEILAQKLSLPAINSDFYKNEFETIPQVIREAVMRDFLYDLKNYFSALVIERDIIPKRVVVSGGVARLPRIAQYMTKAIKIPTQTWGIRGAIHLKHSISGQRQFLYDEPALAVAMGMLSKDIVMVEGPTKGSSKKIIML